MFSDDVRERLRNAPFTRDHLNIASFSRSAYAAGNDRAPILEYQTPRPLRIRSDESLDAAIIAHETFQTDGTAGNGPETFNLSGEFIDAPPTAPNVVAYVAGNRVTPDSVTYGGPSTSSVSIPDDGTTNAQVDIFYTTGDQAGVEVEKVSPNDKVAEGLVSANAGLLNRRPQSEQPFFFEPDTEEQPLVPSDFRVRVYFESTDVSVAWADSSATATGAGPDNFVFSVPVVRGQTEIAGLGREVRHDMAER
jgi:hypothetical protein